MAKSRRSLAKNRPLNPGEAFHRAREKFSTFAQITSHATGHPLAFLLAVFVVIVWGVTGPLFDYSDTWQLVINTGTTIVTFLMVFLIQNTQNRDTLALQLKLSELVIAVKGADNTYAELENLTDEELEDMHKEFHGRAEKTLAQINKRKKPGHGAKKARRSRGK